MLYTELLWEKPTESALERPVGHIIHMRLYTGNIDPAVLVEFFLFCFKQTELNLKYPW